MKRDQNADARQTAKAEQYAALARAGAGKRETKAHTDTANQRPDPSKG